MTTEFTDFDKKIEFLLDEIGQKNYFNWKGHKKFAEWLVLEVNPETIVDLGVDFGYSSFCFALPNIGNVYGIDCFEGDEWCGKRNTYDYVLSKKDEMQLNNVNFIKGYFDDVVKTWDKKIDILHIDGFHSYEAVKNDYETWNKFVKDDGIILFHDTSVNDSRFGIRKFFNEINLPKINFIDSNGLGVISKNKNIIEKIKSVFPNDSYEEFENEKIIDDVCIVNDCNQIFHNNIKEEESIISILEKNPFIITDKNTICYKKYPEQWPWMQYHSYIEHFYEKEFKQYKNKKDVSVCEIGIDVGGSIALWSEYFKNGHITGIDISTNRLNEQYKEENFHNVKYFITDAYDKNFIQTLPTFDIIIDDGPHTFASMIVFIEEYLNKLNPGGLMVIEDIPSIEWIDYFKLLVPKSLKTETIDIRNYDQRYDSLMFSIQK